jgi:outer membrane protein, adhesin transport system
MDWIANFQGASVNSFSQYIIIQRQSKMRALAATLLSVAIATSVNAESLQSVVQRALETNPELGAIRFNRQAIDQELKAARGLHLPTVDLRADHGRSSNYAKSAAGIVKDNDWHTQNNVSGVLSQRLFDGFEATHEVARQKDRVESARWRVTDTANSIALRSVQAYLEVLRAHSVLSAARSNLSQLQSINERVRSRVTGGKGNSAEETEAGARVASGRAIVAEAEARAQDAEALFRAVVGGPPAKLSAVNVPRQALPKSVELAVAEAKEVAPSVIATQHDAAAASAAVGGAYSRLYPKLNFELSGDRGRDVSEVNDRSNDARAMLVVRWNLFNGGIDRARIDEAKSRAIEATEISHNTQRIIERETRVSWNAMTAAGARVPAFRRQLELNRATRATYRDQYDAGQRRLLDLLEIQNEVFVTESSLRTEELIGQYNAFRVLASIGRLVPALGLEFPGEATLPYEKRFYDRWLTSVNPHRQWNAEVEASTGTK